MNADEKCALLHAVYKRLVEWRESLEEDGPLAANYAYLVGAVCGDGYIELQPDHVFVEFLRGNFQPNHLVWRLISYDETGFKVCLECGALVRECFESQHLDTHKEAGKPAPKSEYAFQKSGLVRGSP